MLCENHAEIVITTVFHMLYSWTVLRQSSIVATDWCTGAHNHFQVAVPDILRYSNIIKVASALSSICHMTWMPYWEGQHALYSFQVSTRNAPQRREL